MSGVCFGRGAFFERKRNPLLMICSAVNAPLSNIVNILVCVVPALSCTVFSTVKIISLMKSLASVQPHATTQYQATAEPFFRLKVLKKSLK